MPAAVSIDESVTIARNALAMMQLNLPSRVHAARPGICGGVLAQVSGGNAVVMFRRERDAVYMDIHPESMLTGERRFALPADVQREAGRVLDAME